MVSTKIMSQYEQVRRMANDAKACDKFEKANSAIQNGHDTAREQGHKEGSDAYTNAMILATVETAELEYEIV